MKTGVLASGNLGYICITEKLNILNPVFVATDKFSEGIIELCEIKKIPLFVGNPRKGRLHAFLIEHNIEVDVLFSINYLFIIEKDIIDSSRYCINFHGSLLPKYRGRTPHVWSIINGEKETGISAHLIDEGCDTGDIILQKKVLIEEEDTGASILEKYSEIYPGMIEEIISKLGGNQLEITTQNHRKATFFGKRTPEDGEINWEWSKERIRNWVRAQAAPYPGAFTYYNSEKITIDNIEFTDDGFDYSTVNGTILSTSPLLIKTTNGVIIVKEVREKNIAFKNNDRLASKI
jgi:methionyl-tRNA formyltransferase